MKRTKKKFSFQAWFKANKFYLLAFILPVISMLIVFAFKDIAPFGNMTYLRSDCYHQYTPYLQILQDKLRSGGSLLYTWEIGGGMNFIAIIAYYLASPANILTLIWPTNMADITDFFIVVKMGLAGFSMTYFLSKKYDKNNALAVAFGLAYALSAYFAAFSWNIMWLDCMWVLPFIILGLEKLVRKGKCGMYCIALAYGIFSNYYIGIMLCLFSVVYFIYLFCVTDISQKEDPLKDKVKARLIVLGKYAGFSLLSGGMTMVFVLPEYFNLLLTKSADTTFPTEITRYFSEFFILFRSLITIPVADLEFYHHPNIYCSVGIFILIPLFWACKNIKVKERIGKTALLLFMLFSLNNNILDYIWHGFHFPNSLPCRESFLYIFVVLIMCYEAMLHIKEFTYKQIIGTTAVVVGLLLLFKQILDNSKEMVQLFEPKIDGTKLQGFTNTLFDDAMLRIFLISAALLIIYALLMCLYKFKPNLKGFFAYLMILTLFCELTFNMHYTSVPSTSDRTAYYTEREPIEKLSEIAEKHAKTEDVGFYRSEMKEHDTRNNGARYKYNSISTFSSVSSAAIQDYYAAIGMQTSFNAYSYLGHTPLTAAMFSVKYEFAKTESSIPNDMKKIADLNGQATNGSTNTGMELYEYDKTLPLGYMVNPNLTSNWNMDSGNPFITQNSFIKNATSVNENIFHQLKNDPASQNTFTAEYMPGKDDAFVGKDEDKIDVYFYCQTGAENLTATVTGKTSKTAQFSATNQNYICHVGEVERGSKITVTAADNTAVTSCFPFAFDEDVWQKAFDELNSQTIHVTEWRDTYIEGTIDAKDSGLVLTSIPYEEGWTLCLDGQEIEPAKVCKDSLIGFSVTPGKHKITFSYVPKGFIPGILISVFSIIIFVLIMKMKDILQWYENKKRVKSLKNLDKK